MDRTTWGGGEYQAQAAIVHVGCASAYVTANTLSNKVLFPIGKKRAQTGVLSRRASLDPFLAFIQGRKNPFLALEVEDFLRLHHCKIRLAPALIKCGYILGTPHDVEGICRSRPTCAPALSIILGPSREIIFSSRAPQRQPK